MAISDPMLGIMIKRLACEAANDGAQSRRAKALERELAQKERAVRECLKHDMFDRAHAVFRYVQASKRPANIMAS